MNKCLILLAMLFSYLSIDAIDTELLHSCIRHYDCSKQGRYTHEYYPFLLQKAARSMDGLEQRLADNGIGLRGRMIISGYEEQAIPSYYTNYAKPEIVDEQSVQSKTGCIVPPHNRFGLMTGFLFKDINYFTKKWYEPGLELFHHINPEYIEIFDGNGTIFQKDAFGQNFPLILEQQARIEQSVALHNGTASLGILIDTWQTMYNQELTSGNNQVVGTQDILFSVEYARHLQRSPLPLLKYFTGGDITYPIEVSLIHNAEVTRNAQSFVKMFANMLTTRDSKKTAYVFCSFVDGVGKSTMLGNIKNWFAHGTDVAKYDHVDNSSSQFADVHQLTDDVIIVDLPAQISHFTYKPDGMVYVDIRTTTQDEQALDPVRNFVREHQENLRIAYVRRRVDVRVAIEKNGFFSSELNDEKNPEDAFVKNLYLLKQDVQNKWVPFIYKGQHYVFHSEDVSQIRLLLPLSNAKSHGLKNVEPAQMLFFNGIRFPIDYELFLDDMMAKIKANGAEQVVFVDFMSMYPRSCRENIRVNYILQQLSLLHPDFSIDHSFYSDIVNDVHLLYLLKNDPNQRFLKAFTDEIALRSALFSILERESRDNLDGLKLQELTEKIREETERMTNEEQRVLNELGALKIDSEIQQLLQRFGMTKEYINLYDVELSTVVPFSMFLENLFVNHMKSDRLNELWSGIGENVLVGKTLKQGECNQIVRLNENQDINVVYAMDPICKEVTVYEPCVRQLRANWYAALSNLLYSDGVEDKKIVVGFEHYLVNPLLARFDRAGNVCLVQPHLPEWTDGDATDYKFTQEQRQKFGLKGDPIEWRQFNDEPYCCTWNNYGTYFGLYSFTCTLYAQGHSRLAPTWVDSFVSVYQKKEHTTQTVMPTSILFDRLIQDKFEQKEQEKMLKAAQENRKKADEQEGKEQAQNSGEEEKKPDADPWDDDFTPEDLYKDILLAKPEQKAGAQLFVRAIATLEMILKDPNASVVVRRGKRQDFIAAVRLLEKYVLPYYFNMVFDEPLFDDYSRVDPVISGLL